MNGPGAVTVRHARVDDALALGLVHVRAWQAAYRGQMPDDYRYTRPTARTVILAG